MAKKILKGVGSIAKFAAGGILGNAVVGSLFGKKKKPATTAAAPAERVMPIADDEAVKRAQRLSILQSRGRTGRSSTILTGGSTGSTLGGG